jgi:hypothetical protein
MPILLAAAAMMRAELKITPAEEDKWGKVADAQKKLVDAAC